ncbi:unnamed protein product [Citrullus colocynthis]|uniref:Uncharacterized protein n=1 Tax=Citrullus colocynthis TaxID=252529 RepID=A0ABP0YJV9_9ROSI
MSRSTSTHPLNLILGFVFLGDPFLALFLLNPTTLQLQEDGGLYLGARNRSFAISMFLLDQEDISSLIPALERFRLL